MRLATLAIAGTLVMCSASAAAQYESTPPIPQFEPMPYVMAVADLHEYYIKGTGAGGTLPQRTNERNKRIRDLFSDITLKRQPYYETHRVHKKLYIECKKSGSGGTKRCPYEIDWGSGYEVIPASMGDTQRHFKDGPTAAGHKIVAVLGRAGKGKNTGEFWGTAKFTASEVQRQVEANRQTVRNALAERHLPDDRAMDLPEGD